MKIETIFEERHDIVEGNCTFHYKNNYFESILWARVWYIEKYWMCWQNQRIYKTTGLGN